MSFFEELKRRNVFRVGIAYGVAAWVLLQVADLVLENINAPEWVIQTMMLMVGLGFIAALVIAWAYEMTPEGIKKESDVDRSQSVVGDTGKKLDRIVIAFLIVAVAVLLYRQSGDQSSVEVVPAESTAVEMDSFEPVTPVSAQKTIAVLPFVNMSSDPEQEYFSDGLAEELLNRLVKNDQLHVAARTSSFQFKGQNLDIADIGRQLKVANILEGSVRKAGNRLRITAQLIQVDNGYHLWSETYEREMDDIFAIQDEISLAISQALETELNATRGAPVSEHPTENLDAYNLYLQARFLLARRGVENMQKANDLFAQAIKLDPQFSNAWSGMAFNNSLLFSYNDTIPLEESVPKTMAAAERAIDLDPSNAEAHVAIGRALQDSFEWRQAETYFERAYALDPKNVGVLNLYGDFLGFIGRFEEGIQMEKKAIELDPLSAVHYTDLSKFLVLTGQFEGAVNAGRRGADLAPDSIFRITPLILALLTNNELDEAEKVIKRAIENFSGHSLLDLFVDDWWGMYYYRKGDTESLRKLVDQNIHAENNNPASSLMNLGYLALFIATFDGGNAAVPWLELAVQHNRFFLISPEYFYLPELMSTEPKWLEFWNRPGLKELIEIRRANPYPPNGLWIYDAAQNGENP
jgi:TolB-like protein/Tfp pilus assembly protein PilF